MGSSLFVPLFITFLITSSSTAPISPTYTRIGTKVAAGVITEICNKTEDPNLCQTSYNSDPRIALGDLSVMAEITIILSTSYLNDNLGAIHFLLNKSTDPQVKKKAEFCLNAYDLTSKQINLAKSSLEAKDYADYIAGGQGCITHATECMTGLEPTPPFLPHENNNLITFCQVIVDVGTRLSSGQKFKIPS